MNGRKVAILGGGVGGLSCAHELVKHGFDVHVFEASSHLGGKARSQYLPGTGRGGRGDLPGEHGFRFYPRFYRHLIATMREIADPLSPNGTVEGNLTGTPRSAVAMSDRGLIDARRDRGDNLAKVRACARAGGNVRDFACYLAANLKLATACDARSLAEYEPISWWDFIGGRRYQPRFARLMASVTRTMVAMDPRRGSARTVGNASLRLLFDGVETTDGDLDRTMTGPTTDCWLEPWRRHLERAGVRFHMRHAVQSVTCRGSRITAVRIRDLDTGGAFSLQADEYVAAVPLEVFTKWLTPQLCDADPQLAALAGHDPGTLTSWMNGAQFFLREDVPLCAGHIFFSDAPWSLTAISQAQFWNQGRRGMSSYGDGRLGGILSVDIADAFSPDDEGRTLAGCTSREQALDRVWEQLLASLDRPHARALQRHVFSRHLDQELRFGPRGAQNRAPLLVHPPGSFALRPHPDTRVDNLTIAADFARTTMDLASMEGANEAARRASRAILGRAGIDPEHVPIFSYDLPPAVERMKRVDQTLFDAGLPHLFEGPWRRSARQRRRQAEAQLARARVPRDHGLEALRAIDTLPSQGAAVAALLDGREQKSHLEQEPGYSNVA